MHLSTKAKQAMVALFEGSLLIQSRALGGNRQRGCSDPRVKGNLRCTCMIGYGHFGRGRCGKCGTRVPMQALFGS